MTYTECNGAASDNNGPASGICWVWIHSMGWYDDYNNNHLQHTTMPTLQNDYYKALPPIRYSIENSKNIFFYLNCNNTVME